MKYCKQGKQKGWSSKRPPFCFWVDFNNCTCPPERRSFVCCYARSATEERYCIFRNDL